MADFTNNVQPVQSQMSPQGGVVDNSVAGALESSGNVLAGIGEGLFGARAVATRKAIDKEHENSYVGSFEQEQLKLANAYEQGGMSQDEARMRMRANYYRALSQYHGDPADLAQAHAAIVNSTGLGKIVETGTKEDQMKQALVTEVAKAGWIKPGMSDGEKQEAVANYQKMQQIAALTKAQSDAIGLQRSQIGLESDKVQLGTAKINQQAAGVNLQKSRLDLLTLQEKRQSEVALGQLQDVYGYKFNNDMNDILRRLDDGKIDRKQAVLEINNNLATVQGTVNSIGRNAGSDYINNLIEPIKMRAKNALDYANGDIDRKILDNQNYVAEAKQKANILGDPEVARIVATSALLPNAPIAFQQAVGNKMFSLLGKNGTPSDGQNPSKPADLLTHDPDEKKAAKDYLGVLKAGIAGSLSGSNRNPEATDAEIQNNLTNVLRGISTFSNGTQAKDFNDVVDFLADPQFGQYVSKHHSLPQEAVTKATEVLQDEYDAHVVPLLVEEYNKTTAGTARKVDNLNPFAMVPDAQYTPTKKDISPMWNGSGVAFMANDPGNYDAVQRAQKLNKDVAPVLNRLVRMSAHLNGGQDYKGTWETKYANIFTPQEKDNVAKE